ncbi:MAG: NAD(P)H-hydrate dehydratase [Candidatus Loosdrechtia sp.]|uniref:ADP-dependent NAD(P)H-hydrate dehydratase n=1 Tax=Candidatus Loosdrechtia sp. TaxID=3101272 RepID=UPI003A6D565A|nr:MAG: NAD(P)H-hydrate dehydratase [Candidatus Jettenia sp. AMX2]
MQEIKEVPGIIPREPDTHKGNCGRILVLAGSVGMTGAACLCSSAALRAGAGMVTLGIPGSLHGIVASGLNCVMVHPLPETPARTLSYNGCQDILRLAQHFDVVAVGPGLSRHPDTKKTVFWLLQTLNYPMVVDADGLNAIADNPDIVDQIKKPVILTPHPGEMSRLIGVSTKEIQSKRLEISQTFIRGRKNVILVLKGHKTIVMDEERFYVNETGNPGMATAGIGDVLTGMIAALLGQRYTPFEAAQLGVYLHGLAGDIAVQEVGEYSLIAEDILSCMPRAFLTHSVA